jgi:hypothetical protein
MISDKQKHAKAKLLEFIQLIKDGCFDDAFHIKSELDFPKEEKDEPSIHLLRHLYHDLGTLKWIGADEGWDLAIEKVREYLSIELNNRLKPKEPKSQIDLLKEKYATGSYICIRRNNPEFHEYTFNTKACKKHGFSVIENDWYIIELKETYNWDKYYEHKLIHVKHREILDAYLADNSVEIEIHTRAMAEGHYGRMQTGTFVDGYTEDSEYILRPQTQYPIFKKDSKGNIYKLIDTSTHIIMFHERSDLIGKEFLTKGHWEYFETIPFDSTRNMYHLQPVWSKDLLGNVSIIFYEDLQVYKHFELTPITPEQLKTMDFIWSMYRQILKDSK